jgi:virginiamycin B lyase
MRYLIVLGCTLSLALGVNHALPAELPTLSEWQVPYPNSRPRDPYVDTDGVVWFVGQRSDYVAAFDPKTESFRQLPLDSGTGPHNLIVSGNDTIWYAGNRDMHIGRLNTDDGTIHKIMMPDTAARDPHTLVFDAAGDIWFTVQGGNFVGKLTLADESVRLVPITTARSRPYGINIAHDGTVWATLFGSNKLVRIDPKTFELTEVTLPRSSARPRRLEITSDGSIWYVDYADGYLGRLNPGTGVITEWAAPSGVDSRPYGMEVDARDRLWFVESGVQPNLFVGFDTHNEVFVGSVPIDSGGGTVRHMHYDEPTNSVWFGTDTNTIGRARLPN